MGDETYIWMDGFTKCPMTATIRRESDTVWIRITRRNNAGTELFVSCYGYKGKRADKEIAKIKRKGIR